MSFLAGISSTLPTTPCHRRAPGGDVPRTLEPPAVPPSEELETAASDADGRPFDVEPIIRRLVVVNIANVILIY